MGRGLGRQENKILSLIWEKWSGAATISEIVRNLQGPGFSPTTAGKAQYNGVYASLSRIVSNLHKRGLLRIFKEAGGATAVFLSDEGIETAEKLKAKCDCQGWR
jgi:hypothetical protein